MVCPLSIESSISSYVLKLIDVKEVVVLLQTKICGGANSVDDFPPDYVTRSILGTVFVPGAASRHPIRVCWGIVDAAKAGFTYS
jgi:hypothetical protein